jgi:hypothetical protein
MLAKREAWEEKPPTVIIESKSVGKPLAIKQSEPVPDFGVIEPAKKFAESIQAVSAIKIP